MISAESQILFAKASEYFILELTLRAWFHAESNKRRTLQPCDIGKAIRSYPSLHFLSNIASHFHKVVHFTLLFFFLSQRKCLNIENISGRPE